MKKVRILIILLLAVFLSSNSQTNHEEEYSWDTITFEKPYKYIVLSDNINNLWEIGEPAKVFLNSPFRGDNAICTGLTSNYPPDNHSWFELKISNFNMEHYPFSVYLEMKHKYDTDKGNDGGYIEVSYDNGLSWKNIIEDYSSCINPNDEYRTKNLYGTGDTLYTGSPGFSGNSDDWITTKFGWEECVTKNIEIDSDMTIIRFNFISDENEDDREGWLIDDIRLFSMNISGSVGASETTKFSVSPNPASEYLFVSNNQNINFRSLSLYNLIGEQLISQEHTSKLFIGSIPGGMYFLLIETDTEKELHKVIIQQN